MSVEAATDGSAEMGLLPPGSPIDLDNCHREPVATPGGIQPHGALLVIELASGRVLQHSANAGERLGVAVAAGDSLAGLIGTDMAADLFASEPAGSGVSGKPVGLRPRRLEVAGRAFDAFAYASGDLLGILELEPAGVEASAAALADDISALLAILGDAADSAELLELAAAWVRRLTGFDRVWIYRFEPDEHGVVIVEDRLEELQPWLGLHFPARDIPPQARALFLTNRVRFIPDAAAVASPLEPLANPLTGEWPDLSPGILRAVSPMHLQYLANMGATASMSIALEVDGRLWGLISGHHYHGPRLVGHRQRLACEVLGRIASGQLSALLGREHSAAWALREVHREILLTALADAQTVDRQAELANALAGAGPALLALCEADGAAVLLGDRVRSVGLTPPEEEIRHLATALPPGGMLFATEAMDVDLPGLGDAAAPCCGVIALALGREGEGRLFWFRGEYRDTVTWGDNGLAPAVGRLHPSGSFATWSEEVTRRSRPWSSLDRQAAESLSGGIGTAVLTQAEALSAANEDLARSNGDLAAFSFIVAHDLREPLRNMRSYLEFFLEDHGETVPAEGMEQLEVIQALSRRMDVLMDSLLDHARAERLEAELRRITLGALVGDVVSLLGPDAAQGDIRVLTPEVEVLADREAAIHVLMNLITNGVKYSPVEHPRIEISAAAVDGSVVITVRDFGIGIAPDFHEAIFDLFRRLHARDAYGGGSGAGLAIAQRLAERQGGALWLAASEPGEGSSFCFSLGGV